VPVLAAVDIVAVAVAAGVEVATDVAVAGVVGVAAEDAVGVAVAEAPTATMDVLVGSAAARVRLELGVATSAVSAPADAATLSAAGRVDSRPAT
jgi:hypothetical protein